MSLISVLKAGVREQKRHQEILEAMEARHGPEIAWVIHHHAEMLHAAMGAVPPKEFFVDMRVYIIADASLTRLISLVADSVNILLTNLILKRELTEVESSTYSEELKSALNLMVESEKALINEWRRGK